jgi:hypothetical protein
MSSILDQVAAAQHGEVRPKSPRQFLSLRLTQRLKLNTVQTATQYLTLAEEYPEARLLAAYRRIKNSSDSGGDHARRFHVELGRSKNCSGAEDNNRATLLALKIERRSVAAAVFLGEHLDYTQERHLSSSREKAEASVSAFLNQLLSIFDVESVALERTGLNADIQRAVLSRLVTHAVRERGIPVWEISKQELLEGYGEPPLKSRKELRQVITGIWPMIAGSHGKLFVQDAAALGLYVQVERKLLS